MNAACNDAELLREYVQNGSRAALGEIARRYTDLVYSAAHRRTHDTHLAEDVTQAVFIILSQRAGQVGEPSRLVGWLYQTTYFTASNALKLQRRRRQHEQARAAQEPIMTSDPEPESWAEIAPLLDQAISQIDHPTRDLLLMRYFQNKTVQQAATETGLSVHAAQKRLARALEQLRGLLARKGVSISAVGVGAILLNKSIEPAPAAVHAMVTTLTSSTAAPTASVAQLLNQAARWMPLDIRRIAIAALVTILIGVSIRFLSRSPAAPLAQAPVAALKQPPANPVVQTIDPNFAAVSAWDQSMTNGPIQKPWPMAVPGCISGTPFPADLFGDGKKEIIIPCTALNWPHHGRLDPIVHPHPSKAALIYAFYLDGTTVPGFPVQLASVEMRLAGFKKASNSSDDWFSSPSAVKISGKDVIVTPGPNLKDAWDRALFVIHGDGSMQMLRVAAYWKPDPGVPVIAMQLQKDGPVELLGGYAELSDNEIRPSHMQREMVSGFDFCIGDTHGDGELQIYQAAPRPNEFKTGNSVVFGFDRAGQMLPGWPQPCGGQSGYSTVMGDLLGDGKMEILLPDAQDRLLAWTGDGRRFGPTYPEDPEKAKAHEAKRHHPMPGGVPANELATSILKENIPFAGPLALADLDGDGRPEIVFYCRDHTLRALHGDGNGFGNRDGIITTLPAQSSAYGVSIANLGDEGAMDFFLGTYWVHRAADGTVTTTDMLPGAHSDRCQPTITDVDSDGLADILVGTDDGRVFIYHTGKPYRRDHIQWETINHDLNHTGCWHNPDPAKVVVPGL